MDKLRKGWEYIKLGDIATTVTSGSRDWAKYYSDTGAKFIRMTNLNRNGINLLLDDLKFVNVKSNSSDGQRTALQANDILMSITAELGKIGFIPENFGEAYINQHTALIRIDPNKAYAKFIAYVLSSRTMNQTINSLNDAGAKAGLNLPTIRALSLNLPPLPEQIKIAEILSTWDNAIQTTEKQLANSQQQKTALMQMLLSGEKRVAGFSGEWRKVKLGNLIQEIKKDKEPNPNSIELLTVKLHYKGVIPSGKKPNATEKGRSYHKRYKGELIIGRQNLHNGGIAIVDEKCDGLIASNAISSFSCKNDVDMRFILNLMSTPYFRFHIDSLIGGTGQKEIGTRELLNISVIVPEFKEQQKIAEILTTADQEIETLQRKLECLKLEKRALMQGLL